MFGGNFEGKPCPRCFGGYNCYILSLGTEGHLPKADGTHIKLGNIKPIKKPELPSSSQNETEKPEQVDLGNRYFLTEKER